MSASVQGVDTNVLVRFFTGDDPIQLEKVRRLFSLVPDGGLYVGAIVLVELNWVLRRKYHMTRQEAFLVFDALLGAPEFTIEDRDLVIHAIEAAQTTGADFADSLIALLHEKAGCSRTVTFDERAQRLGPMIAVEEALA